MLNRLPWLCAALVLVASLGAGTAEETLRFKFKAGETIHYIMRQESVQKLGSSMAGIPMTMTVMQIMDMTLVVKAVEDDGRAAVTQTFDRIQMKIQSPQGLTLEYDSAAEKEPEGLASLVAPMLGSMVKKPINAKVTPRGLLTDIEFPQGFMEGVAKALQGSPVSDILSEDNLKHILQTVVLPEEPVVIGKKWTQVTDITNAILGKVKLEVEYEYAGPETRGGKRLEKILSTTKMSQTPGEKQALNLEFKGQEAKSTLYFDNQEGRVVEAETKQILKITTSMMGQNVDMDMTITAQFELAPPGAARGKEAGKESSAEMKEKEKTKEGGGS